MASLCLCVLVTAGCTGTVDNETATTPTATPLPSAPAVSINETPVQYAEVNGVSLAYREFGEGDPLLLITGFGEVMEDWNETFVGMLAEEYHVYMYDHRAMGHSGEGDAPYTLPQLSDDAAGLVDALGHESMHIYGVSMGSSVSQQLVVDHPETVRKLVLSSPSYIVGPNETATLYTLVIESAGDPSLPEGVRKEAGAILAWEGTYDGLSGITNDVMLLVGTDDVITPDSIAVQMAGEIEGSWLVRFKGIPHVGSAYAPEEYGRVVLTFLEVDESPE
ncbi:alpha/beta hydrolase [Methanofollis sp. W23]|uniref:alpha/beta fold hydrolase n=1 Tax=Methanofollis sp. W23 TaxID=2817849 RepID=UPI001FD8B743|nr:alpha/beta hydrolase [Methanofollis sp. W23]